MGPIVEFLRENIFNEKFDVDNREPLFHIGNYGVTGTITTSLHFIAQFLIVVTVLQGINFLVGIAAYYGIVYRKVKLQASIQACIIGYGILLPIITYTPYYLIRTFDIRNCLLLINLVGVPVLTVLRLAEALHGGRLPAFAKNSAEGFVLYFGVTLVVDHDTVNPVRATTSQLARKVLKTIILFVETSVLLSILSAYNFQVFPSTSNIFYWGNMFNNLLAASVISCALDTSCSFGEAAMCVVTGGLHFADSHQSPMTKSTSVSNFWGQRWNRLVADSLRRGAFGPMRRVMPRSVAAILTFLFSGVVHEYMLFVLEKARDYGEDTPPANNLLRVPYKHQFGHQFAFFIWNGFLLVLERIFDDNRALLWIQKNVPNVLRTTMVMFLVLPITHLFTDEYDQSGIFRDISMAFPRIQYMGPAPNSTLEILPFEGVLVSYATKQFISGPVCPAENNSAACHAVKYLFGAIGITEES